MTTTFERISAILVREYKLSPDQLTLDAPLEGLGIDSLASVELLWNIEDAFKLAVNPDRFNWPGFFYGCGQGWRKFFQIKH